MSFWVSTKGIHLIEPQDFPAFVSLEEAPSFENPGLGMCDTTERPEAVERIPQSLLGRTLTEPWWRLTGGWMITAGVNIMCQARNPYGDGSASPGIGKAIMHGFC